MAKGPCWSWWQCIPGQFKVLWNSSCNCEILYVFAPQNSFVSLRDSHPCGLFGRFGLKVSLSKCLLLYRVKALPPASAMYLLREPAVHVPDSDLECMLGPREPREETGGRKCWQCAAAAFVLGLLMMTAFALKPDTGLTSSAVSDTVQMESMEDPVWKQVLGRKAFKQFEHDQDHQEVSPTTGTTSSTHLTASTTLAATEVTTASSSIETFETTTAKKMPKVSEAVTAAPLVAPAAPSPIVQDSPGKVDKIVFSYQGSGNPLDQIAREFMDEAGKLNPESEEHKSLKSIGKMLTGFAASVAWSHLWHFMFGIMRLLSCKSAENYRLFETYSTANPAFYARSRDSLPVFFFRLRLPTRQWNL